MSRITLRSSAGPSRWARRGFTLVEVLVVVSIIVILVALLLPALGNVRVMGRERVCVNQLRQTGTGFFLFANDHRNILPGSYTSAWVGDEEWQKSWMGSEVWVWGPSYEGSILPYIGGAETAKQMYRCPSLETGVFASGIGSNGFFDYSSFLAFSGARRDRIPPTALWTDPATDEETEAPTPLIVEEDPARHINSCCKEPGHANIDAMGTWHRNGTFYFAADGQIARIEPSTPLGPSTWDWRAETETGDVVQLSSFIATYGNTQKGFGGWQLR